MTWTKATRYHRERAEYVRRSGYSVDINTAYSTVAIGDIFMQGDDADTFIDEMRTICKRFPSMDPDTAACCLAADYID